MTEHDAYYEAQQAYKDGDLPKCLSILESTAAENDDDCRAFLGSLYLEGEGVPKDTQRAISILKTAAERTNKTATYLLGITYLWGKGVPENKDLGIRYLKRAALMNFVEAQFVLGGALIEQCSGVFRKKGPVNESIAWVLVAAQNGHHDASKNLNNLKKEPPKPAVELANNIYGAIQSLQMLSSLDPDTALTRLAELEQEEWS